MILSTFVQNNSVDVDYSQLHQAIQISQTIPPKNKLYAYEIRLIFSWVFGKYGLVAVAVSITILKIQNEVVGISLLALEKTLEIRAKEKSICRYTFCERDKMKWGLQTRSVCL